MQVLVIGGTEFISLHLVRALLRDGHRVAVLNRGRNPARLPAGVRTIVCDRLVRNRPILVPGAGGWLRQFGHVEDLADAMAAMLGVPASFGQAYNVTGEEAVTQVGFVELIGEVLKRPVTFVHVETEHGDKPVAFGQNLVYDCHAVYTTTKIRAELGIRARYSLAAGLAQTYEWY